MLDFIKTFRADEDGAVTVDWVVLTAAIVGLGIAVMSVIFSSTEEIAKNIDTSLQANKTLDSTLDGK